LETIKVLVYKRWNRGGQQGSSHIGTVETGLPVEQLTRIGEWKKEIKRLLGKEYPGETIESINVLHNNKAGHVSVTLAQVVKKYIPGKPVTIGGRPIVQPQPRRTMASVARSKK